MVSQRKRIVLVGAVVTLIILLQFRGQSLYSGSSPLSAESGPRQHPAEAKSAPKKNTPSSPLEADSKTAAPAPAPLLAPAKRPGKDDQGARVKLGKKWEDVREHFPAQSFIQLPSRQPETLPKVQHDFPPESEAAKKIRLERQAAVKKVMEKCWASYRKYAWQMDELAPLTGKGYDWFGGWGVTLFDSLDTLWIMGMKREFAEAVDAIVPIDFSPGTSKVQEINTFEVNIRFLGGLLSAYDLSGDKRLLEKAKEVGTMLYACFDTPNRMPVTRWRPLSTAMGRAQFAADVALSAEIGSFSLEFTRLSQLTGDPKWFDATQRITDALYGAVSKTRLPGMFSLAFNARDMDFTSGGSFKLGAMADSMYEYFPKTYALLGGQSPVLKELYERSADTAIKHTLFKPLTPDNADILMVGEIDVDKRGRFMPRLNAEHLGCYVGGWLALGGKLTENAKHIKAARQVTDGCIWAYKHSPLGIMPETFSMEPCARLSGCLWNEARWKEGVVEKNSWEELDRTEVDARIRKANLPFGFTKVTDARYLLRPEAIESVFVLYRVTGDATLLDRAWDMFTAIEKHSSTELANAALADVTVKRTPTKQDRMESFWMAETLKYFYLIFSEPSHVSLDEYVFNTEAHPLKRPS